MSKWIWKFGEFEHYHNTLLHNRRVQYGYPEPPVWKLYSVDSVVRFQKEVTTNGGVFYVHSCGNTSVVIGSEYKDMQKQGGKREILLNPGTTKISITVSNPSGLPCLYLTGVVETDESWLADDLTGDFQPVGCWSQFSSKSATPENFPFSYRTIFPENTKKVKGGMLLDFGKENFARVEFQTKVCKSVEIRLGESVEEAMSKDWCVIRYKLKPVNGKIKLPASAFRYIFISDKNVQVRAEHEYLPLKQRGNFRCKDDVVNRVWDLAAYTFHLNSREFFLDGIKRDRWVWSGDAYQSIFVNRYLFFDKEIERRTLIALGGKTPFKSHINTIMDYSFYWVISIYEYYKTYGDLEFLHQIYPQLTAVMDFCQSRADSDGFMRGKAGDWIFIDWAPMDKEGALCAEQVLYTKALNVFCQISSIVGKPQNSLMVLGEKLQERIFRQYYNEELGAFVDSYESGKNIVTRQSNLLAYLFLPITDEVKKSVYRNVILNDEVPQITTPYFKFYENEVHCLAGNKTLLEESMRNYYGDMIKTGATSLYEEFDPKMNGAEHFAMYGNPFEKSLCHAWSASPIYLLARYRLGVVNTGVAYNTFEVRPNRGDLAQFSGTVPLPTGYVSVNLSSKKLVVLATVDGGTLLWKDKIISLPKNEKVIVDV